MHITFDKIFSEKMLKNINIKNKANANINTIHHFFLIVLIHSIKLKKETIDYNTELKENILLLDYMNVNIT